VAPALVTAAGDGPLDQDPELEAAWTAAALLSAKPERRDVVGSPNLTHDYDLLLPDGRVIALEVTRMSVPEVVEMWDAIEALDWGCPELAWNWSISLHAAGRGRSGPRVKRFREKAPALLCILEKESHGRVGDIVAGGLDGCSQQARLAIEELRRLGTRSGGPVGQPVSGAALVLVGTSGPGGAVDGTDVNSGVERAIEDNLTKLRAAPGDERHLFVWVDSTDPGASVAMWSYTRPPAPGLPAGIDCVWVGLWQGGMNPQSNAFTLWRVVAGGPWEVLDLPAVRDYAFAIGASGF
jgi:hypothetical protein